MENRETHRRSQWHPSWEVLVNSVIKMSVVVASIVASLWAGSTAAQAEETTIVAFGDSTTATRGPLKIYAKVLEQELPARGLAVRVINAGIGGHNTNNARARFQKDVLAHEPDVVIVQFGINDSAVDVWRKPPAREPRVSLKTYAANLTHLVKTLTARKTRVGLMTPNPLRWTPKLKTLYGKPPYDVEDADGFNVLLKKYAQAVRELGKREQVTVIDVYATFETFGKKDGQSVDDLLLDGMHPNDRGQRIVAELLVEALAGKQGR